MKKKGDYNYKDELILVMVTYIPDTYRTAHYIYRIIKESRIGYIQPFQNLSYVTMRKILDRLIIAGKIEKNNGKYRRII